MSLVTIAALKAMLIKLMNDRTGRLDTHNLSTSLVFINITFAERLSGEASVPLGDHRTDCFAESISVIITFPPTACSADIAPVMS